MDARAGKDEIRLGKYGREVGGLVGGGIGEGRERRGDKEGREGKEEAGEGGAKSWFRRVTLFEIISLKRRSVLI